MSPTVSHGRKPGAPRYGPPDAPYWSAATKPLHVLAMLLPLIVFYEVGSFRWLRDDAGVREGIKARWVIGRMFEAFGVHGLWMPPVLLIIVLLVWHFLLHERWRVRPGVVGGMVLEALAWAVPLMVLGQLLYSVLLGAHTGGGAGALAGTAPGIAPVAALGLGARATIAVGAGLYEEMVFRMLAIALVHGLVHDVIGFSDKIGRVAAVVASAAAFALYHEAAPGAQGLDAAALAYYFAAGLYFGAVYLLRGLGIVVGAHAAYDLAVLLLPTG
ncbi:MAG: CPBP family intramembrane metalloprotease [Phycisphaerales bacterium]|nr:CPBP family intramembrane metalloprotease [Phycisphaerales bacterium]